jgi:hypothetical protein
MLVNGLCFNSWRPGETGVLSGQHWLGGWKLVDMLLKGGTIAMTARHVIGLRVPASSSSHGHFCRCPWIF